MKKQQMFKDRSLSALSGVGRILLLLMAFILSTGLVFAQKTVTGIVTGSDNKPLTGVSIIVKGTTTGTISDVNGKFMLSLPADAKSLVFTFVGMEPQEVAIGSSTVYNVILAESLVGLDEVVVVGYGEQSRSKLTTSISKLDTKVLANAAISNAGSALQGTISGLRVITSSGQPGTLPSILLRGGASITSPGSPLVVVDGVVRTLNDVNPADIESMQVLKDAASTAIYGARANNGVILITTKKGKSGVSDVTYKVKMGVNYQRESYNYVNARDYIYYNRVGMNSTNLSRAQGGVAAVNPDAQQGYGFVNPQMFDIAKITSTNRSTFQTLMSEGWQWMMDPITEKDTIVFKDYLGQIGDAAFNKAAYTQDHNLSFSGGNDKARFAASLGYYSEDGLVISTKYERFSATFNGSYKVKDNLEISTGTTFSDSKRPAFLPGDIFFRSQAMFPTFRPYDLDGNYASGTNMSYGNPLYYVDKNIRLNDTRRSIFNVGANWEIIPDLSLKIQANIYYTDYQEDNFNKKLIYQTGNVDINRTASARYEKAFQQQHNITLEYKKKFNSHNMSLLAGGEYYDLSSYVFTAAGKSAPTDEIYTLNSAVERTSISSTLSDYRMLSAFSRFNYDYNGKYLFTAVLRYDGTSSLADNRWGAFPGISAGWNMHQEDFFKASPLSNYISILKPRLSYGVNGNIAGVGNYETQGGYGIQTFYNAQAGYLNTGLINSGLRWEKSKSFDGGVEIGLLNNKANINLNYFRRTTTDLLTNLVLPDYTGFGSFRTNLGNLLNSGFESELNLNILKLENGLTWDFSFNASFVKNKILKLPYNGNLNNRQGGEEVYDPKTGKLIWVGGYQEGGTIGDLIAFKQDRIYKDWDDVNQNAANRYDKIANLYGPALYALQTSKTGKFPIEPGDVVFKDFDQNDTIDSRDRYVIGNIYPKWTGGFSTTITFKNISLYGRFDYALGHMIYNDLACRVLGQWVGTMNLTDWIYDTWTPENTDVDLAKFYYADYPKYNYKRTGWLGTTGSNMVSRFYEKGDYLALREVTLSYNFPQSITSKLKIASLQAYVTGQNLSYFTREYTGVSPELGGFDPGRYPLPRTVIFGLQVSF
jgi:TonB-linked SusC/RagA family outer membrane protein